MPQLAQLNLAKLKAPQGDPSVQEFFDSLDPINALAEASPGFVWRLVGEVENHTATEYFLDPSLVVNLSVWESLESFHHFVYKSGHVQYIKRKKEWFEKFDGPHTVMWWLEEGRLPTLEEALEKLEQLRKHGPSAQAFTPQQTFEARL